MLAVRDGPVIHPRMRTAATFFVAHLGNRKPLPAPREIDRSDSVPWYFWDASPLFSSTFSSPAFFGELVARQLLGTLLPYLDAVEASLGLSSS
jgi:hypothetical protein